MSVWPVMSVWHSLNSVLNNKYFSFSNYFIDVNSFHLIAVKILGEINDEIHILRNSSVVIQCVSDDKGFIKTNWCRGTYKSLSTSDLCDDYFYVSTITNGNCSCLNTAITSCNWTIFHISAEKIQECQYNVFDFSVYDDEGSFISKVNATLRIHNLRK